MQDGSRLEKEMRNMSQEAVQILLTCLKMLREDPDAAAPLIYKLGQEHEELGKELQALAQHVSRQKLAAEETGDERSRLLVELADKQPQWIVVMEEQTGEVLYVNHAAKLVQKNDEELVRKLEKWLRGRPVKEVGETRELTLPREGEMRFYSVSVYPLHWQQRNAAAYVITDVNAEKERVKRLENHAHQDTLTSVFNRYYGMKLFREWLAAGRTFCICFVDLDNLKYVNDNFGHFEGDRYIIRAADLLADFSPNAVAARLGGDEFMVLIPEMSVEKCEERMDEIRKTMDAYYVEEQSPYMCGLSYGVIEVEPGSGMSASDLLGSADDKMYQYKRSHKKRQRKEYFGIELE